MKLTFVELVFHYQFQTWIKIYQGKFQHDIIPEVNKNTVVVNNYRRINLRIDFRVVYLVYILLEDFDGKCLPQVNSEIHDFRRMAEVTGAGSILLFRLLILTTTTT